MSPDDVTTCQVKLDGILSEYDRPGLVGKVRQHVGWTDDETGEEHPPVWVAEVRYRGTEPMRVATIDVEHWTHDWWTQVAGFEIENLTR